MGEEQASLSQTAAEFFGRQRTRLLAVFEAQNGSGGNAPPLG